MPKPSRRFAPILLPLLLLGCPTPEEQPPPGEDPDTPAAGEEAYEDVPEAGRQETFALEELEGSGISGTVELTSSGPGETLVVIHVEGIPDEASPEARVVRGSCAEPGGVVAELEPVALEWEGRGMSDTVVDLSLEALLDGDHVVLVADEGAQPTACADLRP